MSEWISVEDRLPEPYKDVVVLTVSEGFDIGFVDDADLWSTKCTFSIVAYWMPLPEPPEKPYQEWDRIAKEREDAVH